MVPATAADRTPDDVMKGTETRGPAADECLWVWLLVCSVAVGDLFDIHIWKNGRVVLCRDLELSQLMNSADRVKKLAAAGRLAVAGRGASDLDCCFFYTRPCDGLDASLSAVTPVVT